MNVFYDQFTIENLNNLIKMNLEMLTQEDGYDLNKFSCTQKEYLDEFSRFKNFCKENNIRTIKRSDLLSVDLDTISNLVIVDFLNEYFEYFFGDICNYKLIENRKFKNELEKLWKEEVSIWNQADVIELRKIVDSYAKKIREENRWDLLIKNYSISEFVSLKFASSFFIDFVRVFMRDSAPLEFQIEALENYFNYNGFPGTGFNFIKFSRTEVRAFRRLSENDYYRDKIIASWNFSVDKIKLEMNMVENNIPTISYVPLGENLLKLAKSIFKNLDENNRNIYKNQCDSFDRIVHSYNLG